jgi:phosphoglycerate dehydrogenase-like enzyme
MRALLALDGVEVPEGVTAATWDGRSDLPDGAEEVEFLVPPFIGAERLHAALARMPRLQVVQVMSAGVDQFVGTLPEGVTLCNGRGAQDTATAEHAATLVLAAQRAIPEFVRHQSEGTWQPRATPGLADKTVLVLGYGSIGAALEKRLAPFEAEFLRVARRPRDGVHGLEALPDLLPEADVVVVVLPLTDETRGLLDKELLSRMKDGALVVNIARGQVIDNDALLAELASGRLRAALDVTDPEPLPEGHALWSAPGLLLTPHVGGNTPALEPRLRRLVADQLRRWAAGEPLENVIEGAY